MQDDPQYLKMMEKSFIMQKYHQRHRKAPIPQIKKQPTILNKAITTGILSTLTHLIAYPLDSIKTRIISKSKLHDVARFKANKVENLTPYLGFFKGYLSILIGNMVFLIVGEANFLMGVVGEGLLKTWIDMSKISSQMGNPSMNMQVSKKILPAASLFAVARDLSARGSFMVITNQLMSYYQLWIKQDINRRYHLYFASGILATLISHPFDVLFTKIASQQQLRYKGVLGTIKTVIKQEGFGKLYSALGFRLGYNLVSMMVIGNYYDSLMNITLQAF